MASKEACDRYAAELTGRFEELVKWALSNWPKPEFPLLPSDFSQSRREISQIAGPKLGDGEEIGPERSPETGGGKAQFRDINPMPWP